MNTNTNSSKKSNKEQELRELTVNKVASIYLNLNVPTKVNK